MEGDAREWVKSHTGLEGSAWDEVAGAGWLGDVKVPTRFGKY